MSVLCEIHDALLCASAPLRIHGEVAR